MNSTNKVVANAIVSQNKSIINSIVDSLNASSLYGKPSQKINPREKIVDVKLECFDFTGRYEREQKGVTLAKLLGVLSNIGKPGWYRDLAQTVNEKGEAVAFLDPKLKLTITAK